MFLDDDFFEEIPQDKPSVRAEKISPTRKKSPQERAAGHTLNTSSSNGTIRTSFNATQSMVAQRREVLTAQKERLSTRLNRRQNVSIFGSQHQNDSPDEYQVLRHSSSSVIEEDITKGHDESGVNLEDDLKGNMKDKGMGRIFDPNQVPTKFNFDISNPNKFIHTPCPVGITVQGYIIREKQKNRLMPNPIYRTFIKENNEFLMGAVKRGANKTANYFISTDRNVVVDKKSKAFVGKLRSNFRGTEYVLYNNGCNPKNSEHVVYDHIRKELALIIYKSNLMDTEGPRKINCMIPKLREDGFPEVFKSQDSDRLLDTYRSGDLKKIDLFVNSVPKWDTKVNAYVLDFKGRVTQPSVKNFLLVPVADDQKIVLTFGRVGADKFTMDFTHPLTPIQAFGICLSSFDTKISLSLT